MKLVIDDEDIKPKPISLPLPEVDIKGRIIVPEVLGRPKDKKISDLTKQLIAIDALTSDLRQKELAKIHNTSQTEVSISSRGYDRSQIQDRKTDTELKEVINQQKYKIADRATSRLMESLDLFRPDCLDQKDLPSAALKMAGIVEKVQNNFEQEKGNNINFVVFAPRMRAEDSYEVIDLRDGE